MYNVTGTHLCKESQRKYCAKLELKAKNSSFCNVFIISFIKYYFLNVLTCLHFDSKTIYWIIPTHFLSEGNVTDQWLSCADTVVKCFEFSNTGLRHPAQ